MRVRKWIALATVAYILYGLFIYSYLFLFGDASVPDSVKGTSADPLTFMTGHELVISEHFSNIRNLLFFMTIPLDWYVFFLLLISGFSRKLADWSLTAARFTFLSKLVYVFVLSLLTMLISFPIKWIGYQLSLHYGVSTQSTASWLKDKIVDFWIQYPLLALCAIVFFWLIQKRRKRWWLYAWCLTVPFTLFLFFIQPVVIDPLYNNFYPLKDQALENKILTLADKAHIPADHVYEVNMSEKTNTMNAYVTGIGENKRIVLWDTTLQKLKDREILFIMAHEMGHYVMKHVYIGLAGYLLLSLAGFFAIDRLYFYFYRKGAVLFRLREPRDIAALPLLLMIVSMLSFAASPFTNAVSRHQERAADEYAINLTKDGEAGVTSFQKLAKSGLSQVNPPLLVKVFRYGHPTMMERIMEMEKAAEKEEASSKQ
ncbi:M48 family metallopeptidase [Bacillus altitudinis]|uniref:M48 family metallopeptidase n=1 Tax=Bacillus pumilus TaxID=1408 RepID=UPI0025A065E6|nr:M48 family metallopeptidase [Bacillus pumilus]MDM5319382.1 M48 family metallopeptidase [Bacillus pumilus]MDR4993976.1 M48 family metallopeptidase [Bacillus altitudinis]